MSHDAVYPCKFLPGGVDCGVRYGADCTKCGWNPSVSEIRIAKLREQFNPKSAVFKDEITESFIGKEWEK